MSHLAQALAPLNLVRHSDSTVMECPMEYIGLLAHVEVNEHSCSQNMAVPAILSDLLTDNSLLQLGIGRLLSILKTTKQQIHLRERDAAWDNLRVLWIDLEIRQVRFVIVIICVLDRLRGLTGISRAAAVRRRLCLMPWGVGHVHAAEQLLKCTPSEAHDELIFRRKHSRTLRDGPSTVSLQDQSWVIVKLHIVPLDVHGLTNLQFLLHEHIRDRKVHEAHCVDELLVLLVKELRIRQKSLHKRR
mmetsp:Transcript_60453/g.107259  ORF Transcript_60453/g.107259 Transcript_60453/m.107259 type:complete len:245 (-) Transcript_60453:532-1266(-)